MGATTDTHCREQKRASFKLANASRTPRHGAGTQDREKISKDRKRSRDQAAAEAIMVERAVKIELALPPIAVKVPTVTARMIPSSTAYSTRAAPSSFLPKRFMVSSNLRIISTPPLGIKFAINLA